MNATRLARPTRTLVASVLAAALCVAGSARASAAGGAAPSGTESALQIQAQELAGQIQADGLHLEQVAESYDAARLRSQQLVSHLRDLQAGMAASNAAVAAAETALKKEALLSYLAGGAPLISQLPPRSGYDPAFTVSYAEIVTGGQHRAVHTYRLVLAAQARQSKQLTEAARQAAASVALLQADRVAASQAVAAQQRTLADVQGRLATVVAQVEAAQQRAEQAAVEASLSRQGPLPPATPARPLGALSRSTTTTMLAPSVGTSPRPTRPAPAGSSRPTSRPAPPQPAAPSITSPPTTAPPPTTTPPTTTPPTTTPPAPPGGNVPARGSSIAVRYAYAQLGKPYQWAGAGPGSFDCSGLTMMAWQAAGVSLPHLAQAQYDMTRRIALGDLLPGDLIFFGTPDDVYHEGIYIGGGQMIDAPATGLFVSISTIYWVDLLGGGRVID